MYKRNPENFKEKQFNKQVNATMKSFLQQVPQISVLFKMISLGKKKRKLLPGLDGLMIQYAILPPVINPESKSSKGYYTHNTPLMVMCIISLDGLSSLGNESFEKQL